MISLEEPPSCSGTGFYEAATSPVKSAHSQRQRKYLLLQLMTLELRLDFFNEIINCNSSTMVTNAVAVVFQIRACLRHYLPFYHSTKIS